MKNKLYELTETEDTVFFDDIQVNEQPEPTKLDDELVSSLQQRFGNEQENNLEAPVEPVVRKLDTQVVYVTSGKGKYHYEVTGTSLQPSAVSLIGGNFETKYRKQLDSIIFSKLDNIDPDHLVPLLFLIDAKEKKSLPVKVSYQKYQKYSQRIAKVINSFLNDNVYVLHGIYDMFTKSNPGKDE